VPAVTEHLNLHTTSALVQLLVGELYRLFGN